MKTYEPCPLLICNGSGFVFIADQTGENTYEIRCPHMLSSDVITDPQ